MSKEEEFRPDWSGEGSGGGGESTRMGDKKAPAEGIYIWALKFTSASLRDATTEKPFFLVGAEIENTQERPTPHAGFPFSFRLYVNKGAEKWAKWCLVKFGYPQELLDATPQPILRRSALIGLMGEAKVLVSINVAKGYINFDVQGWQRRGEDKLDLLPRGEEKTTDIREDVKQAKTQPAKEVDPLDALDDEPEEAPTSGTAASLGIGDEYR